MTDDSETDAATRGSHTIFGLTRKRAEIAGIVADHERKLKHWREALTHIDATLKLFNGTLDPNKIKPKRPHTHTRYLPGPDLARHAMDELRKADGQPIPVRQIVDSAIARFDIPDQAHVRLSLKDRLGRWITDKAEAGEIQRVGPAHKALWRLSDRPEMESHGENEPLS